MVNKIITNRIAKGLKIEKVPQYALDKLHFSFKSTISGIRFMDFISFLKLSTSLQAN